MRLPTLRRHRECNGPSHAPSSLHFCVSAATPYSLRARALRIRSPAGLQRELRSRLVPQTAVRKRYLAFRKDTRRAGSAFGGVGLRVNRGERLVLGCKNVVLADDVEHPGAFEQRVDRRPELAKIELHIRLPECAREMADQLGTGAVDEIDAGADQQQMTRRWPRGACPLDLVADV